MFSCCVACFGFTEIALVLDYVVVIASVVFVVGFILVGLGFFAFGLLDLRLWVEFVGVLFVVLFMDDIVAGICCCFTVVCTLWLYSYVLLWLVFGP